MSQCSCSACAAIFTCVSAFDMHRVGSFGEPVYAASRSGKSRQVIAHTPQARRCLSEAEMLAKGMARTAKGWWMTRPSETHWAEGEANLVEALSYVRDNIEAENASHY